MDADQRLSRIAANLLAVRTERRTMFPAEIFDEYGWTMLLLLFVAHGGGRHLSEADLLEQAETSVAVGRRWLAHLVGSGHIRRREEGAEVALSTVAVDHMRTFLNSVARIHAGY